MLSKWLSILKSSTTCPSSLVECRCDFSNRSPMTSTFHACFILFKVLHFLYSPQHILNWAMGMCCSSTRFDSKLMYSKVDWSNFLGVYRERTNHKDTFPSHMEDATFAFIVVKALWFQDFGIMAQLFRDLQYELYLLFDTWNMHNFSYYGIWSRSGAKFSFNGAKRKKKFSHDWKTPLVTNLTRFPFKMPPCTYLLWFGSFLLFSRVQVSSEVHARL